MIFTSRVGPIGIALPFHGEQQTRHSHQSRKVIGLPEKGVLIGSA